MSYNRLTAKTLFQSIDKYEQFKEMVEEAVKPLSPSLVSTHPQNRVKLDDQFIELVHHWKDFKRDINKNGDVLNEKDENGDYKYEHNDEWFKEFKKNHYDLIEQSELKLNDDTKAKVTKDSVGEEEKMKAQQDIKSQQDKKFADSLGSQISVQTDSISTAIDNIAKEIMKMGDGEESQSMVQSIKDVLNTLNKDIDEVFSSSAYCQYICFLAGSELKEKETARDNFIKEQKLKVSSSLLMLTKKVKAESSSGSSPLTNDSRHSQTFLKKADPPKWLGDPIEFADFKRKWINQVSSAKMPPETELDKLRENIPSQASKALFGETKMEVAWKTLENLYGDKDLIINKLKMQLKNIKVKAKRDFDIIIELVTDVNNIILRLKSVGAEEILHVDNEFLAAVFRVLPPDCQKDWLHFDKTLYRSKWAAFVKFMEVAREEALQTKVLMTGYEKPDKPESSGACHRCGKVGHKAKHCPEAKVNAVHVEGDTGHGSCSSLAAQGKDETKDPTKNKEDKKKARENCGKCPLCKERHTYVRQWDKQEWPSDRLFKCEKFKDMSCKERGSTLERLLACPRCTSWSHQRAACTSPAKCGRMIGGNKCGGEHSSLVCGSGNAYVGSVKCTISSSGSDSECSDSSSSSSDSEYCSSSSSQLLEDESVFPDIHAKTLLVFQEVPVRGATRPANICWDQGSNRCIVTHSFAKLCAMRSHSIVLKLDVVGQLGEPHNSCYYIFELVTRDGTPRKVWAYGLDKIMEPSDPVDLLPVRNLFPHIPDQVFSAQPGKEVDILMGNNFLGLHPVGGRGQDVVGDLVAFQSEFGLGWVIAGTHPSLNTTVVELSSSATNLARIYKCLVAPELSPSFWEGECLGVLSPKRCGRCLRCNECTDPALVHSRKDQDDLEMIRQGIKLVDKQLQVSYYFSRDPHCLPNNRAKVIKMAEKQEKRMLKSGLHDVYCKEIQKYIDRGGVVKLTKEEKDNWRGPVNYISHHGVFTDSTTTPLRVVTNSSLNNGGRSLNDCLPTGPNSLNPMMDIMLRFRCHEVGMIFDLTKAYNSLHTGPIERNLRRFVYRFNPEDEWEDYAFDCVAFGDNPAANCLEIGRNLTADAGAHIDPIAARKLKEDSYVDDNLSGGTAEDVARMKGVKLANGMFSGTMQQILDMGSLKAKVFVSSGDTDEELMNLIGNKALGYHWKASSDMMAVSFPIYLTNKRKKARTQPPLCKDTLGLLETTSLSKRVCLGITNGILDFLGIACPFTLRFKLLMRQLFESAYNKLEWEDKVPEEVMEAWKILISEAVLSECIVFPRCARPPSAIGNPLLVSFSDGAFPAYSASVYLQWQIPCNHGQEVCEKDYDANLLLAKARVTPLSGYTIPRSELSGTLLQSRLSFTAVKALQSEESMCPKGVVPLSDSKCTISAMDTVSRVLKPFFHNRVSEILDNMAQIKKYCPVEDLHYVSSQENPADLATRGNIKPGELGPGSFWQKGPSFLCSQRGLWPVTRDFTRSKVPDEEVRLPGRSGTAWTAFMRIYSTAVRVADDRQVECAGDDSPMLWKSITRVLYYSDSIQKVLGILAKLIKGWSLRSRGLGITKEALEVSTPDELLAAERLLLLSSMPQTVTAVMNKKLVSLNPEKEGNIVVTRGRIGEKSLSRLLGVPHLPILMPESRAAVLYMEQAHRGELGNVHNSIAETLARSRQKVWIVRGRDLAKKVTSGCYQCRRENKVMAEQQMSRIKEESLTICRPFTYISLDYAGPILVKGAVNARSKMKCWMLIYCCRSTKAVVILPTCGYDTQSFLLRHEEFCAKHGAPQSIVSDRGSQLVSAGRILAQKADKAVETPEKWDWDQIVRKNQASNWHFVPIGSPHFNGIPESTVKTLKKTLKLSLHPGVELTYPELQTLLAKISYTVNSRPLGLANVSASSHQEDNMMPLTPNMMLLARSSNISPPLEYSKDDRFCSRLAFISQVEKEWWDRWIKVVLPTLLSYKKWKLKRDNLREGELVMLRYNKQFKDDYCLAKVTQVHPNEDGLVRKVTVSYRKRNPKESKEVYLSKPLISEQVAIHRLHRLGIADEAAHGVDGEEGVGGDYLGEGDDAVAV